MVVPPLAWNKVIGLFVVYNQWLMDVKGKAAMLLAKVMGGVVISANQRCTKCGCFLETGTQKRHFSKSRKRSVSEAFNNIYIYFFICFCIIFKKKHPKYQISCRRHENMHIFT